MLENNTLKKLVELMSQVVLLPFLFLLLQFSVVLSHHKFWAFLHPAGILSGKRWPVLSPVSLLVGKQLFSLPQWALVPWPRDTCWISRMWKLSSLKEKNCFLQGKSFYWNLQTNLDFTEGLRQMLSFWTARILRVGKSNRITIQKQALD